MKKYQAASTIAFAAALAATPALAQDNRDTYFDGPYVSATFGMGALGHDTGETIEFDTNQDGTYGDTVRTAAGANAFAPGFCNGHTNGNSLATGGCLQDENHEEYAGRIGYDRRMGNFVGGLLVEVSKSNSRDFTTAFSSTPASYTIGRKADYAASLRARAGYTPGGGALFYVTGGGSFAKIKHSFNTTNTTNSFTELNDDKMKFGYQLGGGGEVMLTNNISLGIEYLYNHYQDGEYAVNVGRGTAPATNPFLLTSGATNMRPAEQNFDFHSLRGTVSFHF
ncbi:outer membrane beta-barrel protein [Novosphingobium sp. G106]|uniref:outer membrane protein n=1 Tax=Novosphingobium sp. G106 TaxID=2849500 RepID=UPI001C2DBC5F|nr:outer membrane beta-barrel protein [Novosphingobium sp. G106]MBV1691878.1 outer membrane beta-barrel protein [Novosphingobium sp. G106]